MPALAKPTYRRGSKKTTDMSVGVLNGKPSIQVNWGGRIYGAPLSLLGSGAVKDSLEVSDIRASGNITFSRNSSVYNNSNRVIMMGGITHTGDGNIAIGADTNLGSLINTDSTDSLAIQNISIGSLNSKNITAGTANVCVGYNNANSFVEAHSNVVIGSSAASPAVGDTSTMTGSLNVIIGTQAGFCSDGSTNSNINCTYIGYQAGNDAEGNANIGIGKQALMGSTSASANNISIGNNSGGAMSGDDNTVIGTSAGDTITSGSDNICIGYQADVSAADAENQVAIGKSVTCTADNTTVIGNTEIILDAAGDITLDAAGANWYLSIGGSVYHEFAYNYYKLMNTASDADDYFKFAIAANGATSFTTVDDSGNNQAQIDFSPQGNIELNPGANSEFRVNAVTKTASGTTDSTAFLRETLNLSSGAGGSDIHYGLRYAQTQTDLAGWDSVYLMHLLASANSSVFSVDNNAQLLLDINDATLTTTTNKGIHIDLDSTGLVAASQTQTNIGLDLDINRDSGNGHVTSTTNSTGIDIDIVGHVNGSTANTGLDINCSGADNNYGMNITVPDVAGDYHIKLMAADDVNDYATFAVVDTGDLTIATVGSGTTDSDLTLDVDGGITLDSANGVFIMKGAGTTPEFSVANSAYAGMILGYTTIGIDAADDTYGVTNAFVTVSDDHKVKFVAPPSGVVEIEVFIYADAASGGRPLKFGLSDASATTGYSPIDFPNSNDVTNEHEVLTADETDEIYINHKWVVTGLTAGTAYEWWLGAACSHNLVFILRWGGNVSGEFAPFIMKATALPAAVTDFAVYG